MYYLQQAIINGHYIHFLLDNCRIHKQINMEEIKMQIIKKEYKVFEFQELKKDVKQEVIDKWYEQEQYPFLSESLQNDLEHFDKYKVFENVTLCYSLSYCQGDGLSFSSEINILNFLNNIYSVRLPEYKKNAIKEYIYQFFSKSNNGMYCYASDSDVETTCNYSDGVDRKYLDRLTDNILAEIQEYYLKICASLEKSGYAILDYRMDFDEFSELCESNGYNFLENGKMVNY